MIYFYNRWKTSDNCIFLYTSLFPLESHGQSKKNILRKKDLFFFFWNNFLFKLCKLSFFLVKIAHKNKQMKLQHQYYISFKGHEHQHMKHCISFVNFSTVLHIKIHMYYYHCNKQIKKILGRMSSITCLYIMNLIL